MISLLHSEPRSTARPEPPAEVEDAEFEIVVGRRQIASVSLVVVVLVAVFSGVSYLIGKTAVPKVAEPPAAVINPPAPAAPIPEPPPPAVEAKSPDPQTIDHQTIDHQTIDHQTTDAPLFDLPSAGQVYIQVGAVEKGLAAIWSEGLRTHGLRAFAAPGPNEKIFRVLIGPLPTPAAYQHAKDVLERIGLAMFGRKYEL
jgi:hypothetical protein